MPTETSTIKSKRDKEKTRKKADSDKQKKLDSLSLPLEPENYVLIGIGCFGLLVGYLLMAYDNNVDGFFSRTFSPVIIIASFVWMFYAILHKPKPKP
ncbi:MAG: hypothetical protein SFU91_07210 [Chloroherpetonaceae bacterium]|nr:hypothetical protein [Chloroherpetonaceae bacterium]